MDTIEISQQKRLFTRAAETLLGLVTGIVADNELTDLEIQFLKVWLATNKEATTAWPGNVLQLRIAEVLSDGAISDAERSHLIDTLKEFAVTDFGETGSVTPEVIQLPVDDGGDVRFAGSRVCLTGTFLYGTRQACHDATTRSGALVADSITKKLHYLVVGTNVSPQWANTSYGRKIQRAVSLKEQGYPIRIISERRWLQVVGDPVG